MIRGRLIILLMVVAGIAMGVFSVGYHHWLARNAIAWWGSDNVELIGHAPQVAALQLSPAGPAATGESVTINGARYAVVQRKDVTAAEGFDHVRHALLDDGNMDWQAQSLTKPVWQFALEFTDGERRLIVPFAIKEQRIGRSDSERTLAIASLATGWQEFFGEHFPQPAVKEEGKDVGGRMKDERGDEAPPHPEIPPR